MMLIKATIYKPMCLHTLAQVISEHPSRKHAFLKGSVYYNTQMAKCDKKTYKMVCWSEIQSLLFILQ